MSEFTLMLEKARRGEADADVILRLVYDELRRLAAAKMWHERGPLTLQPTALVHEAWLRLGGDQFAQWENRRHFFAAAAEAMRRILIDRARQRLAQRRGAGQERVALDEVEIAAEADDTMIVAVHEALARFAAHDASKAELVKLRYFGGFTLEECAAILEISVPTAKRWWSYGRAWLYDAMQDP